MRKENDLRIHSSGCTGANSGISWHISKAAKKIDITNEKNSNFGAN